MNEKRKKYLSWDGYFMGIAFISSLRSKDPNTRHGACIVNLDNKIIGIGYSGFPIGCSDDEFPWNRDGELNNTKTPYVVHAELNAILNSSSNIKGAKMFLYSEKGYYPCSECSKAIIQSGISEVIMATAIIGDTDRFIWEPTQRMFKKAKVKTSIIGFNLLCKDMDIISSETSLTMRQININRKEGKIKTGLNHILKQ